MTPAGGGARARWLCQVTVGFFVLTPCGAPAAGACVRCTRTICTDHGTTLPGDAGPACPECAAAARGATGDLEDELWEVMYRRGFYWEASERTGDDSWWTDFDSYDREAFDVATDVGEAMADVASDLAGALDGDPFDQDMGGEPDDVVFDPDGLVDS